jgi:hypothetical protein
LRSRVCQRNDAGDRDLVAWLSGSHLNLCTLGPAHFSNRVVAQNWVHTAINRNGDLSEETSESYGAASGCALDIFGLRLRDSMEAPADGCSGYCHVGPDSPPPDGARKIRDRIHPDGTDGQQQSHIAGPTDASLPRNMPVGARIVKRPRSVSYERDGQRVSDFSLLFYVLMLGVAAVCSKRRVWQDESFDRAM